MRGHRLELQGAAISSRKVCAPAVSWMPRRPRPPSCGRARSRAAGRGRCEIVLGLSGGRLEVGGQDRRSRPGGRAVGPATSAMLWRSPGAGARRGARGSARLPVEITLDDGPGCATRAAWSAIACISRCTWCGCPGGPAQSPGRDRALPSRCRGGDRGPYAAGLACLSEDEATFGAVVLDLGAGVTGVARFADRRLQERACRSARST